MDRYKAMRNIGPLQPCGTKAAYWRHIRRGEAIDQACRDAVTAYNREWRRKNYLRAAQIHEESRQRSLRDEQRAYRRHPDYEGDQ